MKCAICQDLVLQASVPETQREQEIEAEEIGEDFLDSEIGSDVSPRSWDLLLDEDDMDLYTDDEHLAAGSSDIESD